MRPTQRLGRAASLAVANEGGSLSSMRRREKGYPSTWALQLLLIYTRTAIIKVVVYTDPQPSRLRKYYSTQETLNYESKTHLFQFVLLVVFIPSVRSYSMPGQAVAGHTDRVGNWASQGETCTANNVVMSKSGHELGVRWKSIHQLNLDETLSLASLAQ